MSITSSQHAAPIAKIAPTQELRHRTQAQEQDVSTHVVKSDKTDVTLSSLTHKIQTDDSRDIDYTRVEAIRAELAAGTLRIDPEKIAQALVQEMFPF